MRRLLGLAELHAVQFARTGQCIAAVTLANPRLARHIALAHQQRQHRITAQLPMVVEIFVSERDGMEALRHQLMHAMFDARRIAVIDQTPRYPRGQPGALVDLAEQEAAGVGVDASTIESPGHQTTSQGVKLNW